MLWHGRVLGDQYRIPAICQILIGERARLVRERAPYGRLQPHRNFVRRSSEADKKDSLPWHLRFVASQTKPMLRRSDERPSLLVPCVLAATSPRRGLFLVR